MSKVKITISQEVLNSLAPQKGMLNAKSSDLENQVFNLHSIVAPTGKKADLVKAGDDSMLIKARYVNAKNKKAFLIPIRGLLNLDIAKIDGKNKNDKFVPGTTPTFKVHDHLLEIGVDGKGADLPDSFSVVAVSERKQEGTGHTMYPPYCYQAFSDRVNELRKVDADADLSSIYSDYDFMQGLYAEDRMERFSEVEATKVIVISI